MPKRNRTDYDAQSLREERKYGIYWYNWLWLAIRPILLGLSCFIIVAGLLYGVWTHIYSDYISPVDVNNTEKQVFTVGSGSSLTRVANNLEDAGLLRNSGVFKYYMDFRGMGQKVQAGTYEISPSMTIDEIASLLVTGDGRAITRNITIIPGWTVEDIADYLFENKIIATKEEFTSLCKDGSGFTDYYYVEEVRASKNVSERKYVLEGYLSPNTYEIYTSATAKDIVVKLLTQTQVAFSASQSDRAEQLNMSMDEIIALASMIEKEAKSADFAKVSAVFHNRLKKNMKLQSDVTVKYASGVNRMSLTGTDLAFDSPYNTYLYSGLPLGPICNPSPDAIQAALYPDETFVAENYLYFCSTDPNTGELYFSKTLKEHEAAVAKYAPLWKQYDESRGVNE